MQVLKIPTHKVRWDKAGVHLHKSRSTLRTMTPDGKTFTFAYTQQTVVLRTMTHSGKTFAFIYTHYTVISFPKDDDAR